MLRIVAQHRIVQLDRILILRAAQRLFLCIDHLRIGLRRVLNTRQRRLIAFLDLQVGQSPHGVRGHSILVRKLQKLAVTPYRLLPCCLADNIVLHRNAAIAQTLNGRSGIARGRARHEYPRDTHTYNPLDCTCLRHLSFLDDALS